MKVKIAKIIIDMEDVEVDDSKYNEIKMYNADLEFSNLMMHKESYERHVKTLRKIE